MLSNKNNLRSELTGNVGVLATTISITAWEWVLWENNMVACLEHYEWEICTKREIIKITAKNNDTFTITRWFAVCIMNDQTKQQGQWSQEFVVGDYLSLYLSKEIWESLTVWITTNETAIQTMVARINAPRTCINNNCQSWKNAIDSAYNTKCGGNAGFGTGVDGDCVITTADLDSHWYKYLCASCEYNFNNLTICPWVEVRFLWNWVPTINVWDKFINCGCIELKSWFVSNTCQTDCWLEKGCEICNQCTNWGVCCGWQWWQFWTWVCGCNGCPWTANSWWYWWQWWNNGWAWSAPSGLNGWTGGCWACRINANGGWWWGGGWGWWWLYWNWWNGGMGWYTDCQSTWWYGWNGWNSGLFGTGGDGWFNGTTYGWNGWRWWDGWNGWVGWNGGWWSRDWWYAWNGWCGVSKWWTWWCSQRENGWNGGNAITNVYGFHLNARNIWNNCVNARWWNGWTGGRWPCYYGWNGWNGWNGGQMIISYDCMHKQGCFDVRWWNGGAGWCGCCPWSAWTAWTAGWAVFRSVNNPYITNFNLESDGDNEAILISWKDPQIKQSSPQQRAKTVVRYSTTNYPTTPTDWTLAVEETTKDQYETTPYSLTGVLDETTYYFTAFAIDQNNNIIDSETSSITTDFWWHVTPNTLLYLPLDGDLIDKSSHQNNWTAIWTISFQTIWTKKYAYFNANSAIQLSSIPVWTWNPSAFTQSAWLKTNSNWLWYMHHFGNDSYHSRSCLIVFYASDKRPLQDLYWWWWDTYLWPASNSSLWNTWIYVGYTYNNGTHKLYINWQLYGTWSNAINISWTNNKNVWRVDWTWWYAMADCIFESGERSAQNFLDYYNKTKKKFGYT